MLANLGLLAGLVLLIVMALRGVNILVAALVASLVVAITNGMGFSTALLEHFPFGPLGAFSFAGKFFVLFLTGAIFGKMMASSGAAGSIASAITKSLGAKRTILITMLVCALLTYGGVVVFVVIFTMYPLGVALMREANLPKRLFCGATALGAGTFTMTALPGTPSIHNVIAATALDTSLFAGALIGLTAAAVMFVLGMVYLERQWTRARANGEGYQVNEQDRAMENLAPALQHGPAWKLSILPLALVLGTIILPRLLTALGIADGESPVIGGLLEFAGSEPILWPSFALVIGAASCVVLFANFRKNAMESLGAGANDAIMPLLNTAAVIGFGSVVTQTDGFSAFAQWVLALPLPPLLSALASVSVVSAIVGSGSGGLQIFMQTFAEQYLAMGIEPETLHRIATLGSGGLDSLPHCGAVIAMLTIMGLKHKEAYRDIFVVTVAIPVIATLVAIGVASVV
ncbi:GntP family permease [Marinobacter halotolerans]|uniref:GntP family permease n=1 Tax=Marinobacter halotolerans TaxID=1569211 RepID=UPI0012478103|nr:GntP family permease [Marinobacter halotolerans]